MNILDRIIDLLGTADQKQLTDYLGLKKTAFTDWKSGKSNSYRKYLVEIADYFKVSLDYLVYGKENTNTLSDDAKELLAYYNSLSDIDRGKLLGRAETLVELAAEQAAKDRAAEQLKKTTKITASAADEQSTLNEQEQAKQHTHTIAYYDYPASAGTGLFLDETIAEELIVEATPEALSADFAIPIDGDSMEKDFSSGDIVLVKSCPNIPEGQIGIFVLDGDVYIKEYGGDCLISHNSKYQPIMLKEYGLSICLGRVLGKAEVIE